MFACRDDVFTQSGDKAHSGSPFERLGGWGPVGSAADVFVEKGGDVALTEVGGDGDDELVAHLFAGGQLQRRSDHGAGGDAAEDTLLDAQLTRGGDGGLQLGGQPGPHKLQGIGPNFVPDVLDTEIYNEVMTAKLETSISTARELGTKEGILGGISTGANVAAALELAAREEMRGKLIVTTASDFGERYISTLLYEDIRG